MATRTLPILTYDLEAYLGDTLTANVTWKDAAGVPVDFTGCTAIGQIKVNKSDAAAVDAFTVTLGNSTNNISYSLTAAKVLALGVGKWYYDIQITTTATSAVRTYITGKLKTVQDVSRS